MERKTVDEMHDQIDALVLSVFESMRNESGPTPVVDADSKLIAQRYGDVCASVDRLIGIDRSEAVQMNKLTELSTEYEASKTRILHLESQLNDIKSQIDAKLVS